LHFRGYKSFAVAVPALAVAAAALSGCGGGGGGNNNTKVNPVGSQLRAFHPGDTWTYKVDGWEYRTGSPNLYVTSGSYVRGIQSDPSFVGGPPFTGYPSLSFVHALTVKWNNNTSLTQNYIENFAQTASGDIYKRADTLDNPEFGTAGNQEYADNVTYKYKTVTTTATDGSGTTTTTTTDVPIGIETIGFQPLLPGTWGSGNAFSSDNSYEVEKGNADGSITPTITNHEHVGISYVTKETITVPAGTFETYKVNMVNGYQGQLKTVNATAWWAPQLGSFVKMDTTETVSTGQQVLHYVLQSTTVPFQ
jgi:hypothetical protein